jgi:hypothetical protein
MDQSLLEEFVPITESLRLKELGFNEPCFAVHYENVCKLYTKIDGIKNSDKRKQSWICTAPTYLQAFRWLYTNTQII